MHIYILEDHRILIMQTVSLINQCIADLALSDTQVLTAEKESSFLELLKTAPPASLYILDIEIRGKNQAGIELAKRIRQQDAQAVIVFFSSFPSFMKSALKSKVEAYNFIDKAEDPQRIVEQFTEAIQHTKDLHETYAGRETLSLVVDGNLLDIYLDDITYIESSQGRLYIHLLEREPIDFLYRISQLSEEVPQLMRVHRSYIVNPHNITHYNKREKLLTLRGDHTAPVSRQYEERVLRWLTQHKSYINE